MKKFIPLLLIVILLAASCAPTEGNSVNTADNSNNQTASIEDIEMTIIDNEPMSLNSLKGKLVILDFWASWCGPCRNSIPFYNEMHEKYADDGLIIIGINVNENEATIRKAIEDLNIKYYMAMPENKLNAHFQVQGIPSMYMFDRDGNQIDNFVGYGPETDNQIESLIMDNI